MTTEFIKTARRLEDLGGVILNADESAINRFIQNHDLENIEDLKFVEKWREYVLARDKLLELLNQD